MRKLLQHAGFSYPFATTLLPGLLIGPAVFYLYRCLVDLLKSSVTPATFLAYDVLIAYLLPAAFLMGALLLHRALISGIDLLGRFTRRQAIIGAAAVLTAYLISAGLAEFTGLGREIGMIFLGFGKTAFQFQVFIAAVLILPPIVEEIAFRHFILSTLPFNRHRLVAVVAVIGSATFFMYAHVGAYNFWPTHALMFTLGVIFAVARLVTGGLLLPVALHCFAVATGLSLNYIWAALGG
ncbi:CPBP family intramembrane glutamic endopeptidase [Pseudomonas aeruginosa]|uniref:CPBP family intramembrane glutamic endopeptidase n=1 Tax=Pseudomonas aeruginosa TaxID=287 RepID=UPI00093D3E5E|nr:CPBP family intramembrane glutamic endopeptidase [Pseudomonas aeruginosa]